MKGLQLKGDLLGVGVDREGGEPVCMYLSVGWLNIGIHDQHAAVVLLDCPCLSQLPKVRDLQGPVYL